MAASKVCLLVDDDQDDQEIFLLALKRMGTPHVKCITVNGGDEALEALTSQERFIPDYIFLDLNMPRMNGKQCLAAIKKIPYLEHVPVIMYTTSDAEKDKVETKQLGAAAFITKPSSLAEVIAKLKDVFFTLPA